MSHIQNLRRGVAALAVVAAFGGIASAYAADPGETYYNDPFIGAGLAVDFSKAMRQASGDDLAGIRAKAFLGKLEAQIKNAGDKPKGVVQPEQATREMLVISAFAPQARKVATANTSVCANKSGGVVFKGYITPQGKVIEDKSPYSIPAGLEDQPCRAWLMAEKAKLMADPAQPPQQAVIPGSPGASTGQ